MNGGFGDHGDSCFESENGDFGDHGGSCFESGSDFLTFLLNRNVTGTVGVNLSDVVVVVVVVDVVVVVVFLLHLTSCEGAVYLDAASTLGAVYRKCCGCDEIEE